MRLQLFSGDDDNAMPAINFYWNPQLLRRMLRSKEITSREVVDKLRDAVYQVAQVIERSERDEKQLSDGRGEGG